MELALKDDRLLCRLVIEEQGRPLIYDAAGRVHARAQARMYALDRNDAGEHIVAVVEVFFHNAVAFLEFPFAHGHAVLVGPGDLVFEGLEYVPFGQRLPDTVKEVLVVTALFEQLVSAAVTHLLVQVGECFVRRDAYLGIARDRNHPPEFGPSNEGIRHASVPVGEHRRSVERYDRGHPTPVHQKTLSHRAFSFLKARRSARVGDVVLRPAKPSFVGRALPAAWYIKAS